MANNVFYVKRTATSGRTPNTTASYATNAQYIAAGELALNMADGILYTSNGSALITVGANVVNKNVTGTLTVKAVSANGGTGTAGQVLASNGTSTYWTTVSSGATAVRQQYTGNGSNTQFTVTGGYSSYQLDVYVNGVKLYNGTEVDVSNGSIITFTSAPPNGSLIEVVGTSSSNPSNYITNNYSGTLSGQLTFSNTITFSNTVSFGSNVTANASTIFVGNSTVNTSVTANQITLNGSNVVTTATALKVYYANGTQAFP